MQKNSQDWEHNPEVEREPGEPVICAVFNCPNHLTPQEQLFGNKCQEHSIKEESKLVDLIITSRL